jgi:Plasmid pRiA4b ORF-3-like protein
MTRQTSKGICTFCHNEYSKAGMSRHLETCKQRAKSEATPEGQRAGRKTNRFHLRVEGRDVPMYWMHLDVTNSVTLATLDQFLRAIWLECCGHLSAFEIDGVRYSVHADMYESDSVWGQRQKNMDVRLDKVLRLGQSCSYEYDFGSTTDLTIKMISEQKGAMTREPIQVIARNNAPQESCTGCGKPATSMCTECIYDEGGGALCDTCAKEHSCGTEMLLPLVNSPRVGVCGYTGQDHAEQVSYF